MKIKSGGRGGKARLSVYLAASISRRLAEINFPTTKRPLLKVAAAALVRPQSGALRSNHLFFIPRL